MNTLVFALFCLGGGGTHRRTDCETAAEGSATVYQEAPAGGFRLPDEQLSYFNVGVSSDPSDPRHPWRLLRVTAKLRDLVVVKVDIDSPSIEEPLVRQILEDDALSREWSHRRLLL